MQKGKEYNSPIKFVDWKFEILSIQFNIGTNTIQKFGVGTLDCKCEKCPVQFNKYTNNISSKFKEFGMAVVNGALMQGCCENGGKFTS